jgi:hypothetical protein
MPSRLAQWSHADFDRGSTTPTSSSCQLGYRITYIQGGVLPQYQAMKEENVEYHGT